MNTGAAIDAVYNLIDTNKDTLVTGINQQGTDREIKAILKSVLSPPAEYYAITIHVSDAQEFLGRISNSFAARPITRYAMDLHVSDFALIQQSDVSAYDQSHSDFRTLVSRIAKLIRDTGKIRIGVGYPEYRIELPDGRIRISDRSSWHYEAQSSYPILYTIVSFAMLNECGDSEALYE